MACRELNQKRYFRSRGLVVPEVQYWRLPNCTCMLDAVHAAFRAIEGHAMENLITSTHWLSMKWPYWLSGAAVATF
jgi:hypothetical protein